MADDIAVRLEGGLGDHLLGMRLLHFIRLRYPQHKIIVYSDCGGFRTQLQISAMSPYVDEVIPVFTQREKVTEGNLGSLENIRTEDLEKIQRAHIFIDGWPGPVFEPPEKTLNPGSLYIPHSRELRVPYHVILASRPKLEIPSSYRNKANDILGSSPGRKFVAINFEKYAPDGLRRNFGRLKKLLLDILESAPSTYILNIFSRNVDFPHWPELGCIERCRQSVALADAHEEMCGWHERILPIMNEDIQTVAPLLERCHYFIGVDNGIKHLAWALDIPRTVLLPFEPPREFILRWLPDYDRAVVINKETVPFCLAPGSEHVYQA
jgi:hypothetical protein